DYFESGEQTRLIVFQYEIVITFFEVEFNFLIVPKEWVV
ncbi:unnamed protein product, partial [marine sediment metagenome]